MRGGGGGAVLPAGVFLTLSPRTGPPIPKPIVALTLGLIGDIVVLLLVTLAVGSGEESEPLIRSRALEGTFNVVFALPKAGARPTSVSNSTNRCQNTSINTFEERTR